MHIAQQDFDLTDCCDAVEFLHGMYNFLEECGTLSLMVDEEKDNLLKAVKDTIKTMPSLTAAARKEVEKLPEERERKTAGRALPSIKEQATESPFKSVEVLEYLELVSYKIVGISSSVCADPCITIVMIIEQHPNVAPILHGDKEEHGYLMFMPSHNSKEILIL